MRTIAVGLGATLFAIAPALADDFAACRSIKDNLARLTCYDAAADKAPQVAPMSTSSSTPQAATKSTWSIDDSKSPVDDSPQVTAMQITSIGDDKSAALIVRCKEHETQLYIAAKEFWGLSIGGELFQVVYRINDAPPVEQKWPPGQGGSVLMSSVFFPGAKKVPTFLGVLPTTGKIFFRVTDFHGVPHDMTFDLDGIDEVRSRVGAACKWPPIANKSPAVK